MRRRINDGLPKYVRRRSYGTIYQPYLGREDGKTKWGPEVNLGPKDMPVVDIWSAYNRENQQDTESLRWLLTEYNTSPRFKKLKPKTQEAYNQYKEVLLKHPMANGRKFGTAKLSNIKRTALQKLVDKYPSPVAINRMIQYLKAAWNWGLNRLENIPPNPCIGLELNPASKRDRYVKPEEYEAIHKDTSGWVYWAMELAFLLRARRVEIVNLKVSAIDWEKKILDWDRAKGSDGEETIITPRLEKALKGALKHSYGDIEPVPSARLLLNNYGKPISDSAWNSALQRMRPKMKKLGMEPFTLHDLKAKGYSDQEDKYAGHKEGKMDDVYDRKKRTVRPAE